MEVLQAALPLIAALIGGVITALVAGRLARKNAAEQREFELDQWLREQKREAYTLLLAATENTLADAQRGALGLMDARSRVRLVGSVPARKAAASIARELAVFAAIHSSDHPARDVARSDVQRAVIAFIAAAREDVGAKGPDDSSLGTVEIDGYEPGLLFQARSYLDHYGGGREEE